MPSSAQERAPDSEPPRSGVRSVPPGRIVRPLEGAPQPPVRGRRLNTNRSWPPPPSTTADYPRVDPPTESTPPIAVIVPLAPSPSDVSAAPPRSTPRVATPRVGRTPEPEPEVRDSEPSLSELAGLASVSSRRRKIAYVVLAIVALLGLAELIALSAS